MFNHISPDDDYDFDIPGSLAYYSTLLEDPTTQITMITWDRTDKGFMWDFIVATPEHPMKCKAWGNWEYAN